MRNELTEKYQTRLFLSIFPEYVIYLIYMFCQDYSQLQMLLLSLSFMFTICIGFTIVAPQIVEVPPLLLEAVISVILWAASTQLWWLQGIGLAMFCASVYNALLFIPAFAHWAFPE